MAFKSIFFSLQIIILGLANERTLFFFLSIKKKYPHSEYILNLTQGHGASISHFNLKEGRYFLNYKPIQRVYPIQLASPCTHTTPSFPPGKGWPQGPVSQSTYTKLCRWHGRELRLQWAEMSARCHSHGLLTSLYFPFLHQILNDSRTASQVSECQDSLILCNCVPPLISQSFTEFIRTLWSTR